MNFRLAVATALALGLANAPSQVLAQSGQNHRIVAGLNVDQWGPQQGPSGTLVTIHGSGFTRSTKVLVDGRAVRLSKISARAISFRIPQKLASGRIALRRPGSAGDFAVGTFSVVATLAVEGFRPKSGSVGSQVEIRGRGFGPSDEVSLGQQGLQIDRWSETSLLVTIPPNAVSGLFTVRSARGDLTRSRQGFRIILPAPFITDFSPRSGPAGTVLRVRGGNYGRDTAVRYGRIPTPIIASGPGWLEIRVPSSARRNQSITLRSRRGTTRSRAAFALRLSPQIGNYSPSWGAPGAVVTLSGRNFTTGSRVFLSGLLCRITRFSPNRISVTIPEGARSGRFEIRQGNGVPVAGATIFSVVYAPVISNLSTSGGAPGTQVVLSGRHLEKVTLYLGQRQLLATARSESQLQFVIPGGARSGLVRVSSKGGQASWHQPFEVWSRPQARKISPTRGATGSTITMSGGGLGGISQVLLGNVELAIVSRTARGKLILRVPPQATSGSLSITAYGLTQTTPLTFEVLSTPVFTRFTPAQGAAGSVVTILGSGFDRTTRARYGNTSARITRWEPDMLTVEIPRSARQSAYLSVESAGGGSQARNAFRLLFRPSIRGWSPRGGKVLSELRIDGRGFDETTIVMLGGKRAKVLQVGPRGETLRIIVPNVAAGSYQVSVGAGGAPSFGRSRFQVEGWAEVRSASRRAVRRGETIMLSGSGLANARFYHGATELPVVKTGRSGRKVWVRIAEGCQGSQPLVVLDGGNRFTTTFALSIAPPPPAAPQGPSIRIDDRRTHR